MVVLKRFKPMNDKHGIWQSKLRKNERCIICGYFYEGNYDDIFLMTFVLGGTLFADTAKWDYQQYSI